MLCRKPYMAGTLAFGCGQCLPCRINRRRQWKWRQFLESLTHEHNSFVTLTYSTKDIPGNWALRPRDLQLFIKRLRQAVDPHKFRYYACGEYGEKSYRPHYHLSLFGLSGYLRINDKPVAARDGYGNTIGGHIHDCWGLGLVHVADDFNHLTAEYVCGYITKKLSDRSNQREWNHPEFARMSNRPGIGAGAVKEVARQLSSTYTDWRDGDGPSELHIGKRRIPLGRYLLNRLRLELGFSDEYIKSLKDRLSYEKSIDMQALLSRCPAGSSFKAAHLQNIEGKLAQIEARNTFYPKRSVI